MHVTCVTWETSPIAARVLQSETWAAWKDFTDKHDSVCDGQLFRALKEGWEGILTTICAAHYLHSPMASLNETICIMGAVKLNPRTGGYFCEFETKSTTKKKEAYLCFRQGRKRKIGKNKNKKKLANSFREWGTRLQCLFKQKEVCSLTSLVSPSKKKKRTRAELCMRASNFFPPARHSKNA